MQYCAILMIYQKPLISSREGRLSRMVGICHRMIAWVLTALIFSPQFTAAGEAEFTFHEGRLWIQTDRFVVIWENGCMVGLKSRLGDGALTLTDSEMASDLLPNGPGSFALDLESAHNQHRAHWSHRFDRGRATFPAHAPATAESQVSYERIPGGVRLTYTNLANDPTAVLVQSLTVEDDTGDLVIRQQARSEEPGLFGIGFSILNIRPDIHFAIPYFSGVVVGGEYTNGFTGWAWPGAWSAGIVVGEVPGGGTFFVFADDPELSPKYLKVYSRPNGQALGFEACVEAPYDTRREVEVCTWRFNTFGGNWMEPAARYKQWLADAYGCRPARERPPEWFHDVALFCTNVSADFNRLAELIDPRHVIIGHYGWAAGFNRNAPFYQTRDEEAMARRIRNLREMGYHYAVYVAHKLVDLNPLPEVRERYWGSDNLLAEYGVRSYRDVLAGRSPQLNENWEDSDIERVERAATREGRFLDSVHPGSDAWIEFYANLMVDFHLRYGMNVFYQDVSGSHYGSAGLIDGRSVHQGTVAAEARIREKLPDTATIGEHWNEVNVAMGAQLASGNYAAWFSEGHHAMLGGRRAHPLKAYVLGDYTGLVMYKTEQRDTRTFHRDQNFLEITGSIPTWRTTVPTGEPQGEARLTLLRADLFVRGFRPWYPADWHANAVAYMRAPDGHLAEYLRLDGSTFCYLNDGDDRALYYARVTRRTELPMPEPVFIDNWIAYDADGPIGLSPERWYSVFPGNPQDMAVTITGLPEGVWIEGVRSADGYVLVALGGEGGGQLHYHASEPVSGFGTGDGSISVTAPDSVLFAIGEAPAVKPGEMLPLGDWELVEVVNGLVTGEQQWFDRPKQWNLGSGERYFGYGVMPPAGGPGAEVSIDGYLRVPQHEDAALVFQMGRLGGDGDGVHFVVRVNGREIWREFSSPNRRGWTPAIVPLGDYAGQDVLLSLAVDCGPSRFSTSNDQSIWGDVRIIVEAQD